MEASVSSCIAEALVVEEVHNEAQKSRLTSISSVGENKNMEFKVLYW